MRRTVIAPKYVFLTTAVLLLGGVPARADSVPCDPASALVLSAGYISGSRPRGLAVADLNGDGLLDVAVANSNFDPISGDSSSLSIHLAIGGGQFAPPTRYRVNDQAFSVVAGDFDLDGYVDLVTANYASNSVSLFRGVGDHGKPSGAFLPPVSFAAGSGPSFALQRDFSGDGRPDLAVLNSTTGSLSILLGRVGGSGEATFSPPITYVLGDSRSSPGTVASADFNGDGIADLVVTLYNSHRIAVLLGTGAAGSGDGGFGAPAFIDVPDFPWTIVARDLNGDGICDLAVTGVGWLTILRGRGAAGHGNGTFTAPVSYASQFITEGTLSMAAGDFNRDGIVDFVASFSYVGRMAMFPGRGINGVGDGTFATPRVFDAPSFAALTASDVSGDSHSDLLALFYSHNGFWVFLDSCATAPPPPVPLVGTWTPQGEPLSFGQADQTQPVGVSDGSGGAIVTWRDVRAGSGTTIRALRLDAGGAVVPGWEEGGSTISSDQGDRKSPAIVSDGAGGAYVGWIESPGGAASVFVQRMLPTGSSPPEWPQFGIPAFTSASSFTSFSMDADGAGGLIVCGYAPNRARVFLARLTAGGAAAPGWPSGGALVWQSGDQGAIQAGPYLVGDGAGGGFVAFWYIPSPCIDHLCPQGATTPLLRFTGPSANGIRSGSFQSATPVLTSDGAGGVLFGLNGAAGGFDVSRIAPTGATIWTANVPVHASWLALPDGAGGAILSTTDGSSTTVLARHIGADGAASADLVIGAGSGTRYLDDSESDRSGGAYHCWTDMRYGRSDLFAVRASSGGVPALGWTSNGNPVCTAPAVRDLASMFGDGQGGAFLVWSDDRELYRHVYAQHLSGDGPVPALASLWRAVAAPDHVRLTWLTPDGAGGEFIVYRRAPQSDWAQLGTASADGSGRIEFDDRDVQPGARYGYRIALRAASGGPWMGETWIDVPTALAFGLEEPRPNPALRDLSVSFTLPSSAPARLDILDVSGRHVRSFEVGSLGPGRHLLKLGLQDLPPGVLFIRLTQSRVARTAKLIVVR